MLYLCDLDYLWQAEMVILGNWEGTSCIKIKQSVCTEIPFAPRDPVTPLDVATINTHYKLQSATQGH